MGGAHGCAQVHLQPGSYGAAANPQNYSLKKKITPEGNIPIRKAQLGSTLGSKVSQIKPNGIPVLIGK